jgi:glycosyltransferase involved in cell wall biosynthesis
MPLVSILVPNFNHRAYLEARLASVFDQEFQDYEVILLDDASTDGSAEWLEGLRGHPKVSAILLNPDNSGSTFQQWNKAVDAAQGEYVWIAESDDRAAPQFLSALVPVLQADRERVLAYCQSWRINQHGERVGDWRNWGNTLLAGQFDKDFEMPGSEFVTRLLLHRNVIPNASAVVFRRQAYLDCGRANPGVRYCGDWLVWLKLALLGKVYFHADALNEFRQHDKSVIASRLADRREVFNKKYDIAMRQTFAAFLKRLSGHPAGALQEQNLQLIRAEAEQEAWLLIKHGQFNAAEAYLQVAGDGASARKRLQLYCKALRRRLRARLRLALRRGHRA